MQEVESSVDASKGASKTLEIVSIPNCEIDIFRPWLIFDLGSIADKDSHWDAIVDQRID